MEFDNWDYTIPILWKILIFPRFVISLLAPAVTNMLGACRSLIGTIKWQHGVIVENWLRHVNETARLFPPNGREFLFKLNSSDFAATNSFVPQKKILELKSHLDLTKIL